MVNVKKVLTILFLIGIGTATAVRKTAPAEAVPQSPCLIFADFLELDWVFHDQYHTEGAYPHPEVTNPEGEWELWAIWSADGRSHGLAPGWTFDDGFAHHVPCPTF